MTTRRTLRTELCDSLRALGHELDRARDPATMRRLIRRRKDLQLKVVVLTQPAPARPIA